MAVTFKLGGDDDTLTKEDTTGSIPIADIRLMYGRNGYWGRVTPLSESSNREMANAVWKLAHHLEDQARRQPSPIKSSSLLLDTSTDSGSESIPTKRMPA